WGHRRHRRRCAKTHGAHDCTVRGSARCIRVPAIDSVIRSEPAVRVDERARWDVRRRWFVQDGSGVLATLMGSFWPLELWVKWFVFARRARVFGVAGPVVSGRGIAVATPRDTEVNNGL